jgi:hypothetical protein
MVVAAATKMPLMSVALATSDQFARSKIFPNRRSIASASFFASSIVILLSSTRAINASNASRVCCGTVGAKAMSNRSRNALYVPSTISAFGLPHRGQSILLPTKVTVESSPKLIGAAKIALQFLQYAGGRLANCSGVWDM